MAIIEGKSRDQFLKTSGSKRPYLVLLLLLLLKTSFQKPSLQIGY
jgi:hypothetical protein